MGKQVEVDGKKGFVIGFGQGTQLVLITNKINVYEAMFDKNSELLEVPNLLPV